MNSSEAANKGEKNSSKVGRALNSGMAFIIAYLTVIVLFYLFTAVVGRMFGFDPQLYVYGIRFIVGRHRWSTGNAIVIWSSGTLFLLLLGRICMALYRTFSERLILFNLVALWASIIAYALAAAQTLFPILADYDETSHFYTNLAIAFNFAGVPVWALYVICLVSLVWLATGVSQIARLFLAFSYSFSKVNRRSRRRKYFVETALLPFVIGSTIILFFFHQTYQFDNFDLQNLVYTGVILLVLLLALLLAGMTEIGQDDVMRYKNLQQLNAVLFVVMMVMLIGMVVLSHGIYLPF
ncbi:MAG: hypothetical protein JST90_00870 [Bacteroidetes bacterium]|nr:hypothetical protein [Bacteroidota bacterium]